mgnify:FL=1
MSNITADILREFIHYNPIDGSFTWIKSTYRKGSPERRAGHISKTTGYLRIKILGQEYQAHRLAWLITYGDWPIGEIDHIDLDKTNNRISNLREATRSQNNQNWPALSNNKSGYKGVSFHSKNGKWASRIRKDGVQRSLGYFRTPQEAHEAYAREATKIFGQFARTK